MTVKKIIAAIGFVFSLASMTYIAGTQSIMDSVLLSYHMLLILRAKDAFFPDLALFANVKRIRLSDTEHKAVVECV